MAQEDAHVVLRVAGLAEHCLARGHLSKPLSLGRPALYTTACTQQEIGLGHLPNYANGLQRRLQMEISNTPSPPVMFAFRKKHTPLPLNSNPEETKRGVVFMEGQRLAGWPFPWDSTPLMIHQISNAHLAPSPCCWWV